MPVGQREDAPVALVFGLSGEVGGEALEGVVGEGDPNFAHDLHHLGAEV